MPQTQLKIGPLADAKPVKLTLSLDPALHADLGIYADIYCETYEQEAGLPKLLPLMLEAFLASDTGFRRAQKQRRRN